MQTTPESAALPPRRLALRARRGIARYESRGFVSKAAVRPLRPVLAPLAGSPAASAGGACGGRRRPSRRDRVRPQAVRDLGGAGQRPAEIRALLERLAAEQPRRARDRDGQRQQPVPGLPRARRRGAPDQRRPAGRRVRQRLSGVEDPAVQVVPASTASARPRPGRLARSGNNGPCAGSAERAPARLSLHRPASTSEGVRQDFDLYSPLVREGGLIAFHDITPAAADGSVEGPRLLVGDVPRFWREIRGRYPSEELVDDTAGGWFGIGLIRV